MRINMQGSEAETPKSKKSEGSSNAQSSSVAASKPKKPVYSCELSNH